MKKREVKTSYQKGEILRLFKLTGSGSRSRYKEMLTSDEIEFLKYAARLGFAEFGNDAPRGGKLGDFVKILKTFTKVEIEEMQATETKARESALAKVLKSEKIDTFFTFSDKGNINIDGVAYSNFYGDGQNSIEICKCKKAEFDSAKFLTRRQVYNSTAPITIIKFPFPKEIKIALYDCDENHGERTIKNVCGFAIWQKKAKIFVQEKTSEANYEK